MGSLSLAKAGEAVEAAPLAVVVVVDREGHHQGQLSSADFAPVQRVVAE